MMSHKSRDRVLAVFLLLLGAWLHSPATASASGHNNNWAVLVDTSRYWFNYRHIANTLSVYTTIKRLGIPDSNILLMLADDIACNPRNPYPTSVFNNADQQTNLYDDIVEVDYRGYEVTARSFLDVFHGRHDPAVPKSKRLLSNNQSNILVYISGHGGDGFMKFQDKEEATSDEIGAAFAQMHDEGRYHEMLFISDTCQAASLYGSIQAPHIMSMASSKIGEDSLSHHVDYQVGLSIIDRFTYYLLEFLQGIGAGSKATMQDLIEHIRPKPLHSTFNYKATSLTKPMTKTLVTDFFGDQRRVATRRHRGTPPLPQCTRELSQNSDGDQLENGVDWQTLSLQSDQGVASNRMLHGISKQSLYTSAGCWINLEFVLSVLFLLSACMICSLKGRQRDSKIRRLQLMCWSG